MALRPSLLVRSGRGLCDRRLLAYERYRLRNVRRVSLSFHLLQVTTSARDVLALGVSSKRGEGSVESAQGPLRCRLVLGKFRVISRSETEMRVALGGLSYN